MIYDIYMGLYKVYNSLIDTLGTMQELLLFIKDSKFKMDMEDFIFNKALDGNICPNCLHELCSTDEIFNVVEYMGQMVEEKHKVFICKSCGNRYD